MKVYLFEDYLKTIHGSALTDDQVIAETESISEFPDCLLKINGKLATVCSWCEKEDYITIKWASPIRNEDEAFCTDEIECPHCGYSSGDSFESPDSSDEEVCQSCGSTYSYERVVSVTYTSSILNRNEQILELR